MRDDSLAMGCISIFVCVRQSSYFAINDGRKEQYRRPPPGPSVDGLMKTPVAGHPLSPRGPRIVSSKQRAPRLPLSQRVLEVWHFTLAFCVLTFLSPLHQC